MMADTTFADDDLDPSADSLLPVLVFADSSANSFGGGSGDEVSYLVDPR